MLGLFYHYEQTCSMMSVGRKIVIFLLMISLQVVSGNAFSKPYIERSSAQIVVAVNTDESRLSPENKVLAVSDADQHIRNWQPCAYVDLNERKECEKLAFILPVLLRFENQYYLIPHPPKS